MFKLRLTLMMGAVSLASPAIAQSLSGQVAVRLPGIDASADLVVQQVPEIDASAGLLTLAGLALVFVFLWERSRRQRLAKR